LRGRNLNPDCTASYAKSDGTYYDFVVAPDGNRATWIETDAGVVVSGTEVRLQPTEAEDAALEGSPDRDAVQIPLSGTANPESRVAVLSKEQPRVQRRENRALIG